jgi:hypothetical protein
VDRLGKCNRNGVVKLHYGSTSHAVPFTLKELMLCKNINRFYLKQGEGSKQEVNKLHSEEHTYLCYLFRPDKLAREQCVWNVGWKDEGEGKWDKFKWLL